MKSLISFLSEAAAKSVDKETVLKKLLKNYITKLKKENKNVIQINVADFYYEYKDKLAKLYPNDNYTKLMEDIYTYKVYDIPVPGGYICKPEIHTSFDGQLRYSSVKCVNVIKYISKPCKEFESLNKYLVNTLKLKPLEIDSISSERVAGKRSSIFSRYDLTLLAHDQERCKRYKTELQSARKATWKARIELKYEMDNGDRYNRRGEDRESEWYGIEKKYAIISFETPRGKTMEEITLYP